MPCNDFGQLSYCPPPKSFRIGHRVAEHVQKHGTPKGVCKLDCLLALAADGIGLVEDGGDAFLFD